MKFLKEEEVTESTEDGKISISIKHLTTSLQGVVLARSAKQDLENQIALCSFLLSSAITKVVIDGVEYPPLDVALKSDLKDSDTLKIFIKILGLALNAIAIPEEDKKKSSQQELLTEPEKSAENAHAATEDTPQKTA